MTEKGPLVRCPPSYYHNPGSYNSVVLLFISVKLVAFTSVYHMIVDPFTGQIQFLKLTWILSEESVSSKSKSWDGPSITSCWSASLSQFDPEHTTHNTQYVYILKKKKRL